MEKLRNRLLASFFCASAFFGCAFAQSVLTPIRDTVTNSDSTLFNGTIAITWDGAPPPGETVSQLSATARVYNGALSLLLVPNTTGTTYQAVYTSSSGGATWTETWSVPASTTPLTLSQIRVTNPGSPSGPAYATLPISIDQVTDLSSDLDTINSSLSSLTTSLDGTNSTVSGLSSTVSSNSASISSLNTSVGSLNSSVTGLTSTVSGLTTSLDGTNSTVTGLSSTVSSNGASISSLNTSVGNLNSSVTSLTSTVNTLSAAVANSFVFVDGETPVGTPNGTATTFTLANAPSPASSLSLYRNGVLQSAGVDFTLSGSSITFLSASIPQTGDVLQAFYRMPGTGSSYLFADAETPTGSIDGVNVSFTLAHPPNPPASLRLYKNGILLLQNTDYTLNGATVVFSAAPQAGGSLSAYYRY